MQLIQTKSLQNGYEIFSVFMKLTFVWGYLQGCGVEVGVGVGSRKVSGVGVGSQSRSLMSLGLESEVGVRIGIT